MTKKEIVKAISQDVGLSKSKTREIVQKTFDSIIDALVTEGRIELRNFGIFEVKKRAARAGRNPRTGDDIMVPERYVVNFKPGKIMEDRVKRLQAKSVSEAIAEAMEREFSENPSHSPSGVPEDNIGTER
jgi:nucleoid DNA-binding protein